ncbi:hypothetical protein BGM24_18710 [Bacillus sp. FJAT-26377]|nr:hypothetical protein [Bacillus sp. FJAT-26377]
MKKYLLAILLLSIFLLLNITGQLMQALILIALSVVVVFGALIKGEIRKKQSKYMYILTLLVVLCLVHIKSESIFYFVSELKIFTIFTLPFVMTFILKKENHNDILRIFFKLLLILVFLINLYGLIKIGDFRYTGFLQYSIYLSIATVIIYGYLYYSLNLFWKILTFGVMFLLGSSSGIFIFLLITINKLKLSKLIKIAIIIPGLYFIYWYVVEFRGREIFGPSFLEIDRVRIAASVIKNAVEEFNIFNYFIGWGIGRELINFNMLFSTSSISSLGFEAWFRAFTANGVYSFAFHNEFLRIIFDFGLIGLVVISKYLYEKLNKESFLILFIACLTNTVIYSTVGLFILSIMVSIFELNRKQTIVR